MVEQFVDEDDFIIKIDFDNQLGHFELTLFYWSTLGKHRLKVDVR